MHVEEIIIVFIMLPLVGMMQVIKMGIGCFLLVVASQLFMGHES
jgi:hypothetical protein